MLNWVSYSKVVKTFLRQKQYKLMQKRRILVQCLKFLLLLHENLKIYILDVFWNTRLKSNISAVLIQLKYLYCVASERPRVQDTMNLV